MENAGSIALLVVVFLLSNVIVVFLRGLFMKLTGSEGMYYSIKGHFSAVFVVAMILGILWGKIFGN